MKSLHRLLAIILLLAIMLATPAASSAAPGDTWRVSVVTGGAQANQSSGWASLSADGRYAAFQSDANNLVSGDTNGRTDIFVHDRMTGTTTRVSVNSSGGEGNAASYTPSISSDGRYVAFESDASNLVSGDTGRADIFVHDRTTGITTRVSVDSSGGEGNVGSYTPSISSDGRYVAFQSFATNLVPRDTNGSADIFVHDRMTGTTTRVSIATGGGQASSACEAPSISSDGRYVTFYSHAGNLVSGDTNGRADVFVHDRITGATTRVSVNSSGGEGNTDSLPSSISSDGRYVAFQSLANNLVPGDTNGLADIFVHDRMTGTTTRVSVDSSGVQGNSGSHTPSISSDGRYVAFQSFATNLVPGDTNSLIDVFVHDRMTGITKRVSVDSSGVQGNNNSYRASISSDGRYVAFQSFAINLVPGDTNGLADIFVHEVDFTPPVVIFGDGSIPPSNGATLTSGPSQLVVRFSENMLGDGSQHAANSLWNYMLLRPGPNSAFDTLVSSPVVPDPICDSDHVAEGDDERVDIISASYDAATFTATLTIDPLFAPLANGIYRLYACGAASILDLDSIPLNGGSNTAINFTVGRASGAGSAGQRRSSLPATGFTPGRVTPLPPQTVSYADLGDLWLEVPKLGLKMPIVGVPLSGEEWNVSWLGANAGWLEGSAYPSWAGNSVLTGHVWNADNSAGPFRYLNTLWWGDKVIVHIGTQQYVYEVRAVKEVKPTDVNAMLKHETLPWLTLVSCKGYVESTGEYRSRVLVRAVLVEVK